MLTTCRQNLGVAPWRRMFSRLNHRRLCRVKNMLAMYLKYHKAGLTPTTPVTSIAIPPVKMSIGRKSLTNLRSEMIFLQGKPVFYILLPSTPPYWQKILRFCWQWTPKWQQSENDEPVNKKAFSNGSKSCLLSHFILCKKSRDDNTNIETLYFQTVYLIFA